MAEPIAKAQPFSFFKTLMLGSDDDMSIKVAQILTNLADPSGAQETEY